MKNKKTKKIISILLSFVLLISAGIVTTAVTASNVDFETQLSMQNFPESYKVLLRQLHEKHPEWKFEALHTGVTLENATVGEKGKDCTNNCVYTSSDISKRCTDSNCYQNGQYISKESGIWFGASSSTISYYLDPRNFLDEENVFQFLNLAFDRSTQNEQGVERILAGSQMANAKADFYDANGVRQTCEKTYAQLIMVAAEQSGASAYYLASKIKQEIGNSLTNNTSVNGKNTTYPGIYNFYNIGAYTGAVDGLKWASASNDESSNIVTASSLNVRAQPSTAGTVMGILSQGAKVNVLEKVGDWYKITYGSGVGYVSATYVSNGKMSYERPWKSPEISIINGAKWIANNYINQGQNTGYLQKFNVNPNATSQMFSHQYMTNVEGAASEGRNTYRAYRNMEMMENAKTFVIPVYQNMPNEVGVSLTISNSILSGLLPGDTFQVTAYPYPSNTPVSWNIANQNVAVVSDTGIVTAVGTGTTVLNVTCGSVSKTCEIQVVAPNVNRPATSVSMNMSVKTFTVGDGDTLRASMSPADTTDSIRWVSSNPSVVQVNDNGSVVAVGVGEADVTAVATSGKMASCHFYVNQRQVAAESIRGNLTRTGKITNISSALNVRSGPGVGYGVVTRISNNTSVVITNDIPNWYAITVNGVAGYVMKEYVSLGVQWTMNTGEQAWFGTFLTPTNATSRINFTTNNAGVATVDSNGVLTGRGAGQCTITATTDNGKSCTMNVEVKGAVAPPTGMDSATVTASSLNLRLGAGTGYGVIAILSKGTVVSILSNSGAWCRVQVGNHVGYVSGEYLSTAGAPATRTGTITASALNVRTGASTGNAVITTVSAGTTVTIHASVGSWYSISFVRAGRTYSGYVSAEYVR